jgi:hypothetical protein
MNNECVYRKKMYENKDEDFWDMAQCSFVEVDRRFRGAHCLHLRHIINVGILQRDYIAPYPRKLSSSYQPP